MALLWAGTVLPSPAENGVGGEETVPLAPVHATEADRSDATLDESPPATVKDDSEDEVPPPAGNSAGAEAAPSASPDPRSPITLEADSMEMDQGDGIVRATGNVTVEWDTTKLRASEMMVNQRERCVEATGDVEYESDELRAFANSAKIDVDDETGTLEKVDMHLQGEPGRFGGERVEKAIGRRVLLDGGYFTTCDTTMGHAPDWELRSGHMDVRFDDYARMRDARLEVRGVPVLYLPYMVVPTKQTRQSGLLPFQLGTSTNRGFLFSLPGYWAIDKHRDLTVTGVLETSARVGLDGLYRYAPSRRRWGELTGGYYNEEIRGEAKPGTPAVGVPNNRGYVGLIHREYMQKWVGYTDILWVGDERFLREVSAVDGDAPEREFRRSQRYTFSRMGAFTERGFTSFGAQSTQYQDLVGTVVDDGDDTTSDPVLRNTLQKPFNGWLRTDGALGPLAYEVDSSAAAFLRDKGANGERLDLATTFDLPLLTQGPVLSRAWARGRGTAYAMNDRDILDEDEQLVGQVGSFPLRGVFQGGVDARTKFARSYDLSDFENWSSLYHTLEPFAEMRYANRSTGDEVPLFDRIEGIDGRDVATYGIDSGFLMRRSATAKGNGLFELGRVSISQSYNLTREVLNDHFSDIDIAGFVQPVEKFALRTLTSYNVGSKQVRGANASLSWETGPMGPFLRGPASRVAAAYRYVRGDSTNNVLQSTEMLARLAFTPRVSMGLKGLYDIVSNNFVEKAIGMTFTSACDCWSVGLGVVQRSNPSVSFGATGTGAPQELQVRIAIELNGLGGFGSRVTQRSSPALDNVEYEDVGFWRAGW